MPSKNEELQGRLEKVIFWNEDFGDPFMIVALEDGRVAKGPFGPHEIVEGCDLLFYGHWKDDGKHGLQFHCNSVSVLTPTSEETLIAYLQGAPGIGAIKARKIVSDHGLATLDLIDADMLTKYLSDGKAQEAADWFNDRRHHQKTMLALNQLFAGVTVPRKLASLLVRDYGAAAPDFVRNNPFDLIDYRGMGFDRCNSLWESLGLPMDSMERGVRVAEWAVASQSGSTWWPRVFLLNTIRSKLGSNTIKPEDCLSEAVCRGYLEIHQGGFYALARHAQQELDLSKRVLEAHNRFDDNLGFCEQKDLYWPYADEVEGLSDHQAEQLGKALSGPVAILTGGPGVGKTYTVAALVRTLLKQSRGTVRIAAPTGKAAVRSGEALRANGISLVPTTMHSALGWAGKEGVFRHNEEEPLKERFFILDEQSMVDTSLLAGFFRALPDGAHVLMVLDPHQLPPVGHGRPALDLIEFGLPMGCLTEPRRNAGKIVECCMAIRNDRRFVASKSLDLATGENLIVTETKGEAWRECVIELLESLEEQGYNLRDDVQVITPMNTRGGQSRDSLNGILQTMLNEGEPWKGWRFRVGDKVICQKNGSYNLAGEKGFTYVANGEQGICIELRDKEMIVAHPYPDRHVSYLRDDPVELAWAITCHKSQGSEWPIVLVMLDEGANRMGCAEWVTTAISRAKHACYCIGKTATASKWVGRTTLHDRKTFLRESMLEFHQATWSPSYAREGSQEAAS